MRENKYRVWIKYQKKMKNVLQIDFINKRVYIEANKKGNPFGYVNFDDCELMQYTGLEDKNSKEIYENDLLEDEEKQLWQVIFEDGCFIIENVFIPGRQWITKDMIKVGNVYEIYENPELLEGRNEQ